MAEFCRAPVPGRARLRRIGLDGLRLAVAGGAQRHAAGAGCATGPASTGARDALEIATLGGAACLGREGELGVLGPGAVGDLVCWPLDRDTVRRRG